MLDFLFHKKLNTNNQIIHDTNLIYNKINKYSNRKLKIQTEKLKKELKKHNDLNIILTEAFATVKVAIKRSLDIELFDVQILGGLILHQNYIAEMKTGEGKTLAAILPAYLNSLTEKSVHIITVNDYLAKRDSITAQSIFEYLNINVGLVTSESSNEIKKFSYKCDITYITNNELGFDYLRDNMAVRQEDIVQRPFYFGIIDEVDSILIDEARTPLIISGQAEGSKEKYYKAKNLSNSLQSNIDYEIDEKTRNILLTEKGIQTCEKILNIKNLYNIENSWIRYIINALKSKELFIQNKDYIIKNQEIIIVDEFTGRIMQGRRWSDGLHQAIEAKEQLPIQAENKTLASITYQNLFLLYKHLCGMTGTAKTEETELDKIYKLQVISIPTHRPNQRKDLNDLVYKNEYNKWQAIANECSDMHAIGRPTLIGTTSIEKSEFLAQLLDELEVPYNLLNAKPENIAKESDIIAQAGQKNTITIATNMAGRGTDIVLGGNPEIRTKSLLINNIKKILNLPYTNISIPNEEIQNILQNNLHISYFIRNKNIEEYLTKLLNHYNIASHDHPDREIFSLYNQLLSAYRKYCIKEKNYILKLGGLYVIGTERHESRRIDNQLRGRAGRQGDKGTSRFFLSLQDNLLRIFGGDKISNLMKTLNINDEIPIESLVLSKSLNSAQQKVESYFYDIRKQLFEYDDVINSQRQAIYIERKRILESQFTRDCIIEYGENTIDEILKNYSSEKTTSNQIIILQQIIKLLNLTESFSVNNLKNMTKSELKYFLYEQLRITYDLRESYLEQLRPGLIRQLEKYYILQQIDKAWQEHLEKMSLLKEAIGWRSYGQQDPLIEYKNEAFNLFINMVTYIRQTVLYLTLRSRLIIYSQK
uniref:Protein translocase subunit SecA n=1 Tax=Callithamnion tetricum TaxID=193179 RepID=A0A4D6WRF2_9FLOR|nr:Preprotein-translocase subunit a [Callithamnion tetricum]